MRLKDTPILLTIMMTLMPRRAMAAVDVVGVCDNDADNRQEDEEEAEKELEEEEEEEDKNVEQNENHGMLRTSHRLNSRQQPHRAIIAAECRGQHIFSRDLHISIDGHWRLEPQQFCEAQ